MMLFYLMINKIYVCYLQIHEMKLGVYLPTLKKLVDNSNPYQFEKYKIYIIKCYSTPPPLKFTCSLHNPNNIQKPPHYLGNIPKKIPLASTNHQPLLSTTNPNPHIEDPSLSLLMFWQYPLDLKSN